MGQRQKEVRPEMLDLSRMCMKEDFQSELLMQMGPLEMKAHLGFMCYS